MTNVAKTGGDDEDDSRREMELSSHQQSQVRWEIGDGGQVGFLGQKQLVVGGIRLVRLRQR